MLKATSIFCCFLCLSACSRPGAPSPESAYLAYAGVASDALTHLRENFNTGNCGLIYSEASDEFRELESHREWLRSCGQLRANLGSWETHKVGTVSVSESLLAHVDGTAFFSGGSGRFRVTWRLESGKARLFAIWLEGAGLRLAAPQLASPPNRPAPPFSPGDPPLKPPRGIPDPAATRQLVAKTRTGETSCSLDAGI